ncbi:LPS export ABC transporter periplasmic protein LptC [Larkinella terrae]|uniref:LPS export ABC transporter periplasmic protein LptC n=1 Tax=Larkinella terrae TaxID=2025311 RepID=A0A7K0EKS5_9BACT|nr:LPS export ABC transporter periplasmic protein LptC [Larkinella terrae]MRS62058.1 LPS export ABC transporter periplasmic protein LptC [Larkinella terrae]
MIGRLIFSSLLAVFVAIGLTGCKEESTVKKSEPYTGPLEEINDVQILYSEKAQLKVKMKTPLQYKYQSSDRVYPKTVNIEFYGPDQQVETTLRADSGHYFQAQNYYRVMGNVVVINKKKNEEMYTPELNWNPTTKKVYTDKPVKVLNKNTNERMDGVGLDTDQSFSHYFLRKVNGVFRLNGTGN